MHKAAKAYMATKVSTTSQGDILIMLYDAAIKNIKQAKVKIAQKDYAAKGILISKAMDIISELSCSLNKDKGGDLADNLNNLYFYCTTRLLKANLKMEVEYLDEVVKILLGIRSAFMEILKNQNGQQTATAGAHGSPVSNGSSSGGEREKGMQPGAVGTNAAMMQKASSAAAVSQRQSPQERDDMQKKVTPSQANDDGEQGPAEATEDTGPETFHQKQHQESARESAGPGNDTGQLDGEQAEKKARVTSFPSRPNVQGSMKRRAATAYGNSF